MVERFVGADGRAGEHAAAGSELERAAVRDAEGELDERAGLAEEDERIDAGERGLAQLRDRGLLPVARFDLRAQARQLRLAVGAGAA